MRVRWGWLGLGLIGLASTTIAWTIETDQLVHPWPKQWTHDFEVGRHTVHWRQRASRTEGVFAGVRFHVPRERHAVWDLANEYEDVGRITPGVRAVRYLEQSPTRQVIQLDLKILWKDLTLTFEVERDPPREVRFRWLDHRFGEFRGVCAFEELAASETNGAPTTNVDMATLFKSTRPVPMNLLLAVERLALLQAVRRFLEQHEH